MRAAAEDSVVSIANQPVDPVGERSRRVIRRSLANHPALSEEEIAAARTELGDFLQEIEEDASGRVNTETIFGVLGFLLHIAAPIALLLGLLTRGGLMLRLFDIAIVTRNGVQASHARALLRSLATWSPFLALWLTSISRGVLQGWESPLLFYETALFLIGVVFCVISPRRGLQDLIARTYLVPK